MGKTTNKYIYIQDYFSKSMPEASSELAFKTPYELIVAVILSAQCTDKRVNLITPALFNKFPNFNTLSKASVAEVFELIKSCSYPNNKSQHLVNMSKMVMSDFKGCLPDTQEELEKIPGVGRKTANVLLSVLYQKPYMAVDTHVFRVSNRIGLTTNAKTPLEVEKELSANFPQEIIPKAHHWLILHGRYLCTARNPKCMDCGITKICDHFKKKKNENIILCLFIFLIGLVL